MIEIPERVKDALRDGRMLKNYKFHVLKDDGTTDFIIDNTYLVSESVKFDERMCSGSEIKFGLCEGSSLEFQYFNKPNINGKQLKTFIDVNYIGVDDVYTDMSLFEKYVLKEIETAGRYRIYSETDNAFDYVYLDRDGTVTQYEPTVTDDGTYIILECQAGDQLEVEWPGQVYDTYLQSISQVPAPKIYEIPMGFFTVVQCPMQFSTGIRKVTAYNKLRSEYLDQKANDLILSQLGNKETLLSMYSIRQMLLSDYQITAYEETTVQEGMPNTQTSVIKTQPKLTDLTKGGTPLNAYGLFTRFGVTPSTTRGFYIRTYSKNIRFSININDYYQIREIKKRIGEASKVLAAYIKKLIDDAQLSVTGQQMVDDINIVWDKGYNAISSRGWAYISSAVITEWVPVPSSFNNYYYCDYAYENGVINSEYPIIGTVSDAENLLINDRYNINVYYPYYISVFYELDNGNVTHGFSLNMQEDSLYYDIDGSQKVYPRAKFFDGSDYTDENIRAQFSVVKINGLSAADVVTVNPSSVPDYTLRDITGASYETVCQFGKLDRVTDLFSGVELNTAALLPRDDLYPLDNLYPGGLMDKTVKSAYSKLWTDTVGEQTFRKLIITYKGLDENNQEKEFILERTVNANGTTDYYMTDNWLFKNLVWTAADVGDYADAMVTKMQGIKWFPFELWGAGLPYLETGDEIEIVTPDGSYTSYILQRQLNGIQNLQDTYINGELDIF